MQSGGPTVDQLYNAELAWRCASNARRRRDAIAVWYLLYCAATWPVRLRATQRVWAWRIRRAWAVDA